MTIIIQQAAPSSIVIQQGAQIVVQPKSNPETIIVTQRGQPGLNGGTASATILLDAGEAVGGQRAVGLDSSGDVRHFSATYFDVIGVTQGAAASGQTVSVQIQDVLEEPSWAWVIGKPIFATENGILSQTPPVSGYLAVVGAAITSTKMRIEPEPPITMV